MARETDEAQEHENKKTLKERWQGMNWKKKFLFILCSFFVFAFVYVNLGHLYVNAVIYAHKSPESIVAKILVPVPAEVREDLLKDLKVYDNMWPVQLFWPFFFFGVYSLSVCYWLLFLILKGWFYFCVAFKWAFITGGPVKWLIP